MTAPQLIELLAQRHAADLFVPQCKNGPTSARRPADGPLRTLDAWAMPRTWSPVTFVGYEVKVSRSDWLCDQKFNDYLPLCHLLSVVAPKGVVELAELPKGVGLLEPIGQGTGQRLITRRKPARRAIEAPTALLVYVLMSRVLVKRGGFDLHPSSSLQEVKIVRARQLLEWTEDRDLFARTDRAVKKRLRQTLDQASERMHAAERRAGELQAAAEVLAELGITAPGSDKYWLRRSIERAIANDADGLLVTIRSLEHELEALERRVEAARLSVVTTEARA